MSYKHFCDDCGKEIDLQSRVDIRFYHHLISDFDMCYTCFNKHWKPLKKKFILEKYADEK